MKNEFVYSSLRESFREDCENAGDCHDCVLYCASYLKVTYVFRYKLYATGYRRFSTRLV